MIDLGLNVQRNIRTSFLVNARTAQGESVLKLDRDCDGQVDRRDPVLVMRDNTEEANWRPVKNVGELGKFLETTVASERGQKLGLWYDRRQWVVGKPNGKIENREVAAIGGPPERPEDWTLRGGKRPVAHAEDLWNTDKFFGMAEKNHPEHDAPQYTAYYYTRVDPAKVHLGTAETPAGPVTTWNEPQVGSRTHVEEVTSYAQDGPHWVPMAVKEYDYTGVLG